MTKEPPPAEAASAHALRRELARRLGLRLEGEEDAAWSGGEPSGGAEALRALVPTMTVGETYFHRYPGQLRAFAARLRAPSPSGGPLRVLSAGCSTGEEAYTLAMIARETAPEAPLVVEAFDVNPEALARARAGRYSEWSLREVPPDARGRWFREEEGAWAVDPTIRTSVRFHERNLVEDDPDFWRPGAWDVVFCRNVLMYLNAEATRAVVERLARSIRPEGLLFLGHAEALRGHRGFSLGFTDDACLYVRAPDPGAARVADNPGSPKAEAAPSRAPRRPVGVPGPIRGRVHALLREERFREALAVLERASAGGADEGLLAVALLGAGAAAEAERVAARILRRGGPDAGAHCVLALCREHAGDVVRALAHHHAAVRTDPDFALSRFHLGRLARRAGHLPTARRELGRALALLPTEPANRILEYGGGFQRDALLRLCRDELRRAQEAG